MTGRMIRRMLGTLVIIGLAGAAHLVQGQWLDGHPARIGLQLFAAADVTAPVARLRGHAQPLPPAAARCANCHRDPAGSGPADAFGGRLDADRLIRPLPRRGGPKVAYEEGGFCRLLREGIDPNDVIVDAAMPRYAVDDVQCHALWRHLTRS